MLAAGRVLSKQNKCLINKEAPRNPEKILQQNPENHTNLLFWCLLYIKNAPLIELVWADQWMEVDVYLESQCGLYVLMQVKPPQAQDQARYISTMYIIFEFKM